MSFNFFSLDYIYYPVSGIMWVWHKVFGAMLGNASPWAWVLSVVFLVFTLRAILFKPFMKQMDSQIKMQAVQPEMKKLRAKYKDDRQRLTEEMMKLNKESGVNPLASCLPALMQAPVFIGLYHVLRSFANYAGHTLGNNYFFPASDVESFLKAKLFGGAPLSAHLSASDADLIRLGADRTTMIWVVIPLTILAGIATHLTSRRSVARQRELTPDAATGQAAIMQKVMLYVFPLGVVLFGPFMPLAILFYWLANNSWTFGQLWAAHRIQDRRTAEESQVVEAAKDDTRFSTPKPGARPQNPKRPLVQPTSVTKTDTPPGKSEPAGTSAGAVVTPSGNGASGNGASGKKPGSGKRGPAGQQDPARGGVSSPATPADDGKDAGVLGAQPPGMISQSQPKSQRPSRPGGDGSQKPSRGNKKGRR